MAGLRRSRVRERERAGRRLRRAAGRRPRSWSPATRTGFRSTDVQRDPIALRAAEHRDRPRSGTTDARRRAVRRGRGAGARISGHVVLVSAPLHEALRRPLGSSASGSCSPAALALVGRAGVRVRGRLAVRAAPPAARSRGGPRSPRGGSTSRSSTPERTRSASSRGRSTGCAFGSRQLDHARREFIANASHELRTPLFALGGFLELLSDEELDEATRREFLATMSEQVDRLAKLATDLLDLSRADAGRLQVRARAGRPRGGRRDGRATSSRRARAAGGHPLELDGSESGAGSLGDEQRVLQIGACAGRERARAHARRERVCEVRARRRRARGRGRRARDPARARRRTSSSGSTAATGRARRAAGSGSRSRASWPWRWAGRWSSSRTRKDGFSAAVACGEPHCGTDAELDQQVFSREIGFRSAQVRVRGGGWTASGTWIGTRRTHPPRMPTRSRMAFVDVRRSRNCDKARTPARTR